MWRYNTLYSFVEGVHDLIDPLNFRFIFDQCNAKLELCASAIYLLCLKGWMTRITLIYTNVFIKNLVNSKVYEVVDHHICLHRNTVIYIYRTIHNTKLYIVFISTFWCINCMYKTITILSYQGYQHCVM